MTIKYLDDIKKGRAVEDNIETFPEFPLGLNSGWKYFAVH